MKRRFIVLVDFSDHSGRLLVFAHSWAKSTGAELLLMHQSAEPVPVLGESEVVERMKHDQALQAADKLQDFALTTIGHDHSAKYHATSSPIAPAIERLADVNITDYVFAGINDKPAIERIFTGDTTARLSEDLENIIIALPAARHGISVHELYVAVKAKYPVNEKALNDLIEIKGGIIDRVKFFSVLPAKTVESATEAYLERLCENHRPRIDTSYSIISDDDPVQASIGLMNRNQGMLALQKGPRGFADMFRKFFTTEMVRQSRVPIIILP